MLAATSARVCIVGGGFAGLSAAIELQKNNIDYFFLEGSNRLGGRVYPVSDGNSTLQLGAEFLNGRDNEIYRIANKLGLLQKDSDSSDDENEVYGIGGTAIKRKLLRQWHKFIRPLERSFEKDARKMASTSVAERFQQLYQQWVQTRAADRSTFDLLARLYLKSFETEWSSPATELALANFDEWDDGSNDAEQVLKGQGFKAILDYLVNQVNESRIQLNSVVDTIDWSASPVKLHLSNQRTLTADYVIVTVPLGHLKQKPQLFSPLLPKSKRNVIKYLGFGSLQKVFLQYDRRWWTDDTSSILTILPDDNKSDTSDSMTNFDVVRGHENTLLLWWTGRNEHFDDQQLGREITEHLRKALNNPVIPLPKRVIAHNWQTDPLVRGAYSYITPSSYENLDDSYKDMRQPVSRNGRPVLFFAGEHTHSTMYQTTVGAYESGIREAQSVIQIINK